MPKQLGLSEPVEPSKALLAGVDSLYDKINELWNKSIEERSAAPAGRKTHLRRLTEQLESMLITIEKIGERHPKIGD